ncbi:MAG TPA: hypothetical protein VGB55_14745 [Tepidisphaeraceae bacterium]|jgi:hypothetical protein
MHANEPVASPPSDRSSPLAWAAFLGASWTWVIGMFLPVLLIRDLGGWSWVIFAVPNIVGAAAMGWVLRSREASVAFVSRHAMACRLFSLVTISFHLFFALWMLPQLIGWPGWVVAAAAVQLTFTPLGSTRFQLAWSAAALLFSAGVAFVLHSQGMLSLPEAEAISLPHTLGLSLVCFAGFALCPYLDLTFHRARQATSRGGAKVAFGAGFGLFFASMIVLTLLYAPHLFNIGWRTPAAWAVAAHLSMQILFTVCVHAQSLQHIEVHEEDDSSLLRPMLGTALGFGLLAAMLAGFANSNGLTYAELPIGEILYRSFLAFYGLVVPAYFAAQLAPAKSRTMIWLVAMLIAVPFYWFAFMHRQMVWFAPGVAVLAVAAIAAWMLRSRAREPHLEQTGSPGE